MAKQTIKVVGLSFRPIQIELKPNYTVKLVKEPDNQYDSEAVKVEDLNGNLLGYVGKNDPYRPFVLSATDPVEVKIKLVKYHKEDDDKLWKTVKVGDLVQLWLEAEVVSLEDSTFEMVTSLTGEKVQWSEFHHKCLDLDGNILMGGSSYMKQFSFNNFDTLAEKYADSNGLDKDDVLLYWDSIKKIAGAYGTAVHEALEHYGKFKPTVGHEKALPRTKHTQEVVKKFLEVSDMENCIIEPLITDVEMGMSGWIDLLRFVGEPKDKRVIIEDYKTAEADPAKWKIKLKEYAYQLNFYGTILYNFGYTIESLVVWHWSSTHWEKHVIQFVPIKDYIRKGE